MIQSPRHLKNYTNLANIQAYPPDMHKLLMETYSDQDRSYLRTITSTLLKDIYLALYWPLFNYFRDIYEEP